MIATVTEWFNDGPMPLIMPNSALVLGGTPLLAEFLQMSASCPDGGRISIAVPFIADGIVSEIPAWALMPHHVIDIVIVTAGLADAENSWEAFRRFRWKSIAIKIHRRLHAKIYSFLTPLGTGVSLVGSHNLTHRGSCGNQEAGVLFVAGQDPNMRRVVCACFDRVMELAQEGEAFIDTLRWPVNPVA